MGPLCSKAPAAGERGAPAGKIRWRFVQYLLAFGVMPFVLLAVFELTLRVAGYGHSTRYFLTREYGGQLVYVPNKGFYRQFQSIPVDEVVFWDHYTFQAPAEKAPDTYRIFILGGSAAQGAPDSAYAFWRILEIMLRTCFPGVRFEIHNAAFPAMSSHVMREVARACAKVEPDLFIVYMGNNEAAGPYGPNGPFGNNPFLARSWVIRSHIALNHLRMFQLLANLSQRWWSPSGNEVVFNRELPPHIQRRALALYRSNLVDICSAAHRAGAAVALCTKGGNGKLDIPLPTEEPSGFRRTLWEAHQSVKNRILGWLAAHIMSPINRIVVQVASERADDGVVLVKAHRALIKSSPDGVPGFESFCDSVHFTFEGNYLLASSVFPKVAQLVAQWAGTSRLPPGPTSTQSECAERLAWTAPLEMKFYEDLLNSNLLVDEAPGRFWAKRLAELASESGPDWRARIPDAYARALALNEGDYLLRYRYADELLSVGRLSDAEREARELVARFPFGRGSHTLLGRVLAASGDLDGGAEESRKTVEEDPGNVYAWACLAEILREAGQVDAALEACRRALAIDFMNEQMKCAEGELLEMRGEFAKAVRAYREAIRILPRPRLAYERLDRLLVKQADPAARVAEWQDALRHRPDVIFACVPLAAAQEALGDGEAALATLRKARALSPSDADIQLKLAEALARHGDYEAAVDMYREIQATTPRHSAEIQTAVARILEQSGNWTEAIEAYWDAIEKAPDFFLAYEDLDALLVRRGDVQQRISEWRDIAREHPRAARAHFHLGKALDDGKDLDAAANAYREACELDPTDAAMQADLGRVLFQKGDFENAVTPLREALKLNPGIPHLREHLVRALYETRDYDAAWDEVEQCRTAGEALPSELIEKLERDSNRNQ